MTTSTPPSLPPTLEIPALWCPIPARINPAMGDVEEHLVEWARRFDLIRSTAAEQRFRACGFGQFAAEVYPRGSQLRLAAEWTAYNWILDDHLDEGHVASRPEEREHLIAELNAQLTVGTEVRVPRQDRGQPANPVVVALADLWRRTAQQMSRTWQERFTSHYRDFLAFTILPMRHPDPRAWLTAPDPFTFIRRRRLFSGCEMSFDLIEVANLSEVPPAMADSDAYRAVRVAANDVISWTNDIYSVRKEIARGDEDHLVAVLRRASGCSWQQSVLQAADMVAEATRDFLGACQDLRAMRELYELGDEEWKLVEESLSDLAGWISGSLHWHQHSPRYSDVAATSAGEAPAYIEGHLY
jgi:hypothetical protein